MCDGVLQAAEAKAKETRLEHGAAAAQVMGLNVSVRCRCVSARVGGVEVKLPAGAGGQVSWQAAAI